MTDPTTARFARSTLGEPAVPAMSYPIMVDGAQVGWSASCYEIARSLATELVVALEAERDDLRARLAVALDGCCPDCGGSGIGADACDGLEHHTPPCLGFRCADTHGDLSVQHGYSRRYCLWSEQ